MSEHWRLSPEEIDSLESGLVNKATTGDVPTFKQMQQTAAELERSFAHIRTRTAETLREYFGAIGFETWVPIDAIADALLNMGVPKDVSALAANIKKATEVAMLRNMTKRPDVRWSDTVITMPPDHDVPAGILAKHLIGGA